MWKNTADIAIRAVLLVSVAAFDVAPAAAAILPVTAAPVGANHSDTTPVDPLGLARIILAQSVDHPHQPGNNGGGDKGSQDAGRNDGRTIDPETRLNKVTTHKIVLDLASIRKECGGYDEVYRVDCLRQGIDMIVATLPDNSEYRDAKRILRQASSRLGRIVSTYQDTTAPKLEVPANANPRFKKRRRYVAIKHEAVPEAMAKAQNVIDEAATQLLRSSENSERRLAHYQEISVAVDSTKVLLRSG
jgi:hypothetical protein